MVLFIVDCPVNTAIGLEDPNNVFHCKDDEICCRAQLQPACCAEKDLETAIYEQLYFWIGILGVVALMAFVIWRCRSDKTCCDVEKPCLVRCGCIKEPLMSSSDTFGNLGSTSSLKSTLTVTGHEPEELKEASRNFEILIDDEPLSEELPSEDFKIGNNKMENLKESDGKIEELKTSPLSNLISLVSGGSVVNKPNPKMIKVLKFYDEESDDSIKSSQVGASDDSSDESLKSLDTDSADSSDEENP